MSPKEKFEVMKTALLALGIGLFIVAGLIGVLIKILKKRNPD